MNPNYSKIQTAQKMAIVPVLATVISTLTYKYVAQYISPELYAGALVSILIGIKDVLKYKFNLKWPVWIKKSS